MDHSSNLAQIQQRPSRGTTISIYGFHETLHKECDESTICSLIAAIAVAKLKVQLLSLTYQFSLFCLHYLIMKIISY